MGIRDEDVRRVREATDLAALIGRRVSLRKVGNRHVGLCPFHNERTPSFNVNAAEGFYHCFGCGESGDAITYVRETEHCEFTEAVEQLAAAAGITLNYDQPSERQGQQRRKELWDLLAAAADFYHDRLLSSPDAGPARAYLRRRGYDRETVVKWRLGYAPPQWDSLCMHLEAPPERLAAAGLAYTGQRGAAAPGAAGARDDASAGAAEIAAPSTARGSASDFFRDRIMFPICDSGGRVVSFAGRLLPRESEPPPSGPKYKNTAATSVYDKSRVLYGLHLAKQAARKAERIVVCEGYTDVIGCSLAGISEAVATCGTALTQQHAELLSRSAKRIVLAFDADSAGQNAAERVHQWERAYGLDIFVAALPPGADPGDLAQNDPPALRRAVDEAQPLHAFRAERILERADLKGPGGRDRAADEAAEVLAVYPADVLIDADLEPIAERIPMGTSELRQRVDAARTRIEAQAGATGSSLGAAGYYEDDPAYSDPGYLDDAEEPPDPGDGYFDVESSSLGWDRGDPGSRSARFGDVRSAEPNLFGPERDLLGAAAIATGKTVELFVPNLFAIPEIREASQRIVGDADWRERLNADVPDRELLAHAAAASADLQQEAVLDLILTALRRHVGAAIHEIRKGRDIPHVELASDAPPGELRRARQQWLVWLRDRDRELRDPHKRIAAAEPVAQWLRGS